MQLSLKSLFGLVVFCAVLAWVVSQVGIDNPMLWITGIAIAVISGMFMEVAGCESRRRYAALVPFPLLFCCAFPAGSLSLLFNAILLFLVGVACAAYPLKYKTVLVLVMGCAAVSLIAGLQPGMSMLRDLHALRKKYPIVSLQERLPYEQGPRKRPQALGAITPKVAAELNEFENSLASGGYREEMLRSLHDRQQELFIRSFGFGVTRMYIPHESRVRQPPLQNIPFDGANFDPPDQSDSPWYNGWNAFGRTPQSAVVDHLHTLSRNDFLDPEGFGAVLNSREQVVGLVPHAFHYPPYYGMWRPEQWTIKRLELISLLKFPEPRVYVLDHLPRMDQLSADDAPTRSLTPFEAEALEQLWTEKDIVVAEEGRRVHMLGSLRAAQQCLECHRVQRGELLGAFSYEILQQ